MPAEMAQELARARHRRRLEDLLRRPLLDDAAVVEDDDPVGDPPGEVHLVGDDDHGHALVGQRLHDAQHLADRLGIERRGRLVEQHQRRLHRERAGDRDPLLLAARQRRRMLPGLVGQPDLRQQRPRPLLRRCASSPSTVVGPIVTLRSTVRCGNSSKFWNTMPMRCRTLRASAPAACTSAPSNMTRPPSSVSSALAQRSSVDLPEPLGPIRQTTSPRLTWQLTPSQRLELAIALHHILEREDRRAIGADAPGAAHSATLKRRWIQSTSLACG